VTFMNDRNNLSQDGDSNLDKLRSDVADGLRYSHTRANANTGNLLEIASFAYAAIELLTEKGLLEISELDERKKAVAGRLVKKFINEGMGLTFQEQEKDKYTFEPVKIDCKARLPICKAACCKMRFALSKQDVEEGIVKWEFGRPYLIAQGEDDYCVHMDRGRLNCTIHSHRPVPCRGYDCRADKRIWADFEAKIVSPELEKLLQEQEE
jgi:Fe-S-cluster containining protein